MTNTQAPYAPNTAPHPASAGAPAYADSKPLSITSLVLGIVSIVAGWTFLAPIAGLVTGVLALKREPAGRTMAIWGIVLNAVMLVGFAIAALLTIAGLGIGLAFLPFAFH